MEIRVGSRVRHSKEFKEFFREGCPEWVIARRGTVVAKSYQGNPMMVQVKWDGAIATREPARCKSLEVIS